MLAEGNKQQYFIQTSGKCVFGDGSEKHIYLRKCVFRTVPKNTPIANVGAAW